MSDVVERLKQAMATDKFSNARQLKQDAIDEVERLKAENEALKVRLKPATRQLLNITKALLDEANAKVDRLEALLDAARICFKNRDQSEREAAVYNAIRVALGQEDKGC